MKTKNLYKKRNFSSVLDRMAGSLGMPKRFKGMKLDKIIDESRKEYFGRVN